MAFILFYIGFYSIIAATAAHCAGVVVVLVRVCLWCARTRLLVAVVARTIFLLLLLLQLRLYRIRIH